ncbi:hypothetical protein IFJ82_09560 [Novacetimonas hansenii]|uniref:hypothetical protein n=1 Tax=Novacetimonas hansenii TaxID=436 RepID=UPI00177BCC5B|nr:hypothetical protein [Novacetimonas hansenii]QOF94198.1 hypothetical protein IFJ82_09560 [Novacetimonas hansenii]
MDTIRKEIMVRKFLVILGLFCASTTAHAQQRNSQGVSYPAPIFPDGSNFGAWGVSSTVSVQNGICTINTRIDQPTFSAHVQDMVDKGIFSKRVSPTMGNTAPHYLMNIFEAEVAPSMVKALFDEEGSPGKCHFVWGYVNPDDYGNDKYFKMEDFYFLKSTYQKVNWDRFNINNLLKIANNFNSDPSFSSLVNQETFGAVMSLKDNE